MQFVDKHLLIPLCLALFVASGVSAGLWFVYPDAVSPFLAAVLICITIVVVKWAEKRRAPIVKAAWKDVDIEPFRKSFRRLQIRLAIVSGVVLVVVFVCTQMVFQNRAERQRSEQLREEIRLFDLHQAVDAEAAEKGDQ